MKGLAKFLIILVFFLGFFARAGIYNYRLVPKEISLLFQKGLISFQEGDFENGEDYLERALVLMFDSGISNLPAYSGALIRLAEKISQQEQREKLLAYSRYFAPDCAELYFKRFWYFLKPGNFSLSKAIEELKGAKRVYSYDLIYRLGLRARLGLGICLLIKILVLLFSLLAMARGGRIFFHWLMDLFPKEYRLAGLVVFLILIFAPFSLGGNLWWVLLWAGILSSVFSSRSFKIVYSILILGFVLEAGLYKRSWERAELEKQDLALAEFRSNIGLLSQAELELFREESKQSTSPSLLLARAEAERRAGDYSTSARLLLLVVKNPELGALAYNNLACLYLELGEVEQAKEALSRAEKFRQVPAQIYYNLSQIYSELMDFDASDRAYQQARALSSEMVSRLDLIKRASGRKIVFARSPIPAGFIEKDLLFTFRISHFFKEGKFRGIFLVLGIILFIWLGRKDIRLCRYCGRVICDKCLPKGPQPEICLVCYQVFISGKVMDPKLKMAQRSKVRFYHQLVGWLGVAFSLIFPGAGLIFEERAGLGIGFLFFPMLFLSWVLSGYKYNLAIMPLLAGFNIWLGLGILIYLLLGLVSVWLYHRLYYLEV